MIHQCNEQPLIEEKGIDILHPEYEYRLWFLDDSDKQYRQEEMDAFLEALNRNGKEGFSVEKFCRIKDGVLFILQKTNMPAVEESFSGFSVLGSQPGGVPLSSPPGLPPQAPRCRGDYIAGGGGSAVPPLAALPAAPASGGNREPTEEERKPPPRGVSEAPAPPILSDAYAEKRKQVLARLDPPKPPPEETEDDLPDFLHPEKDKEKKEEAES